jgi:hypothetical protein
MVSCDGHQNSQPGPFERFLQQSSVYREFLEDSGADQPEAADDQAGKSLADEGDHHKPSADLQIARARFAITLEVADYAHPSATLVFPSRASRLEPDDLHHCIRRVLDAAYPDRRFTPQVALIHNGSETRLDLANYWDGALYERALAHSSLAAVIYYLQIPSPLPRVSALDLRSSAPDLMYGFVPAYDESREFISISYLQAQYIGVDLVSALLSRHKEYVDADPLADAEDLAGQIRAFCKVHAPQPFP